MYYALLLYNGKRYFVKKLPSSEFFKQFGGATRIEVDKFRVNLKDVNSKCSIYEGLFVCMGANESDLEKQLKKKPMDIPQLLKTRFRVFPSPVKNTSIVQPKQIETDASIDEKSALPRSYGSTHSVEKSNTRKRKTYERNKKEHSVKISKVTCETTELPVIPDMNNEAKRKEEMKRLELQTDSYNAWMLCKKFKGYKRPHLNSDSEKNEKLLEQIPEKENIPVSLDCTKEPTINEPTTNKLTTNEILPEIENEVANQTKNSDPQPPTVPSRIIVNQGPLQIKIKKATTCVSGPTIVPKTVPVTEEVNQETLQNKTKNTSNDDSEPLIAPSIKAVNEEALPNKMNKAAGTDPGPSIAPSTGVGNQETRHNKSPKIVADRNARSGSPLVHNKRNINKNDELIDDDIDDDGFTLFEKKYTELSSKYEKKREQYRIMKHENYLLTQHIKRMIKDCCHILKTTKKMSTSTPLRISGCSKSARQSRLLRTLASIDSDDSMSDDDNDDLFTLIKERIEAR